MVKVSLVKCDSYEQQEVYNSIKQSIGLIGGLKLKKNAKVLIKPNLLRPKHPKFHVTTHPEIVRAIIKILKEKDCKIYVGDSPGFHNSFVTAKVSGLLDVCEQEDVPFIDFSFKKTYLYKKGKFMKRFELANILDDVDYIINVPKLKTHVMMGVTFAIKNTFGLMVGLNKSQMHLKLANKEKFAKMLVDLNNFVKPALNIMDGIIGMEGNGPGNGEIKKVGIISASYDSLAMDIVMCKLVGFNPLAIPTNKVALAQKEKNFIDKIQVVGEKIDDVKVKFEPSTERGVTFVLPEGFAKFITNLITSRPIIDYKVCKACGECIKICPARTISLKDYKTKKAAWINKKNCIRCFCCHEICLYNAINLKKSAIGRLLEMSKII